MSIYRQYEIGVCSCCGQAFRRLIHYRHDRPHPPCDYCRRHCRRSGREPQHRAPSGEWVLAVRQRDDDSGERAFAHFGIRDNELIPRSQLLGYHDNPGNRPEGAAN